LYFTRYKARAGKKQKPARLNHVIYKAIEESPKRTPPKTAIPLSFVILCTNRYAKIHPKR
jgi:hypothetical protein